MPNIYIAADHAGFDLKAELIPFIEGLGHAVIDCGATAKNQDDDYPEFVTPCAEKVAADPGSFGVIIGASGEGEAMAANRVPGIRAAVFYGDTGVTQTDAEGKSLSIIESERVHNNANILSLGARFISVEEAKSAVATFLTTPFSGEERHERRINEF